MTRVARRLYYLACVTLAGVAASPVVAQTLGLAREPEISLWRVVGALVFCCLLGGAGALALKYRMQGRVAKARYFDLKVLNQLVSGVGLPSKTGDAAITRLRVVETVRLSYQVEVSLLECDGVGLLIVTSPHGAFVANPDAPAKTEGTT